MESIGWDDRGTRFGGRVAEVPDKMGGFGNGVTPRLGFALDGLYYPGHSEQFIPAA